MWLFPPSASGSWGPGQSELNGIWDSGGVQWLWLPAMHFKRAGPHRERGRCMRNVVSFILHQPRLGQMSAHKHLIGHLVHAPLS